MKAKKQYWHMEGDETIYSWHIFEKSAYFMSPGFCCQIQANLLFRFFLWVKSITVNTTYEFLMAQYWEERRKVCEKLIIPSNSA